MVDSLEVRDGREVAGERLKAVSGKPQAAEVLQPSHFCRQGGQAVELEVEFDEGSKVVEDTDIEASEAVVGQTQLGQAGQGKVQTERRRQVFDLVARDEYALESHASTSSRCSRLMLSTGRSFRSPRPIISRLLFRSVSKSPGLLVS